MASSRLEKIGTIYTRTTGLIKSGALRFEDRPLWYDLYEAFPPKEEPRYDRPAPNIKLRQIFYEEDKIRAMFHKNNKQVGTVTLTSDAKSLTQKFIECYRTVVNTSDSDEYSEIYKKAMELLNIQNSKLDEDNKNKLTAKDDLTKTKVVISEVMKDT